MSIDLEGETRATTNVPDATGAKSSTPALTILAHPDSVRVGDRLLLRALTIGREVLLSRTEPTFASPPRDGLALGGRFLSRQPIRLRRAKANGGVVLDLSTTRTKVEADGEPVEGERVFSDQDIDHGVVLTLAHKVVLLFHMVTLPAPGSLKVPFFGLIGDGDAMTRLRHEIQRLAPLDVSVLLRGESGTGKELVARALHRESPRRDGPFVAVNMGSLGPSLASAALFGVERGAYTGADRSRPGHFRSAEQGTLFLDEIGEAAPEVQVMLLRALESREIQPVGSSDTFEVDVRVIAATDASLETAMVADRFKTPLYHRLAGYTVYLPTLKERREDLGQLLQHFLRRELDELGERAFESGKASASPWPGAQLVARLALHGWPGNVRELRNVVRRLLISGSETLLDLERLLGSTPPTTSSSAAVAAAHPTPRRQTLRKLDEVDEAEFLEALRTHRWHVQATAEALNISRPNLYRLMESHPLVRTSSQLDAEEIQAAAAAADGDLEAAALQLQVSTLGLKRRMRALGLHLG